MLIRITRSFCLRRGVDVTPGEVVEATRLEAMEAVAMRRAVVEAAVEADDAPVLAAAPQGKKKWGNK